MRVRGVPYLNANMGYLRATGQILPILQSASLWHYFNKGKP